MGLWILCGGFKSRPGPFFFVPPQGDGTFVVATTNGLSDRGVVRPQGALMRPSASSLLFVAVAFGLLPGLAGCIDGAGSTRFVATASTGHEFSSWDYAAATIQHMTASLSIDVDEPTNAGTVLAEGGFGANGFRVELTEFNHSATDFHSGGVAANFDEHGDTGVGNNLMPKLHLLLATWGPGKVALNGMDFVDPYTGSSTLDAHLMVTDTGVRDDVSGKVLKSDGATPFDPAAAGDSLAVEDLEVHLILSSRFQNDTPAPESYPWTGELRPPTVTASFPFEVKHGEAVVNITIDLGSEPYEVGPFRFSLVDAEGAEVDYAVVQQPSPTSRTIDEAGVAAGQYSLRVTTEGVPLGNWDANITVTYPPKPFFYFFWEDVVVEKRVS